MGDRLDPVFNPKSTAGIGASPTKGAPAVRSFVTKQGHDARPPERGREAGALRITRATFTRRRVFALALVVILVVGAHGVWLATQTRDGIVIHDRLRHPEFHPDLAEVIVEDDRVTYRHNSDPGTLNYTVGDIIAGTTGYGYLRWVRGIQRNGNVTVVETERATLADVILQGGFDLARNLPGTRSHFKVELGYELVNTTFFKVKVVGEAEFTFDLTFSASFSWGSLESLYFSVGTLSDISLGLQVTGTIAAGKEEKHTLLSQSLPTIDIPIGPLVIVILPILSVGIGATVGTGTTVGVGLHASSLMGVQYHGGRWSPFGAFDPTLTFSPPTFSGELDATVFVAPRLDFLVYGVAGPFAVLKPYLKLHASLVEEPWWALFAGVEADAGVALEAFHKVFADVSFQVFDKKWELAQAPPDHPSAPLNLTAEADNRTVRLAWEKPEKDGGSAVTNYSILRGTAPAALTNLTTVGSVLTYDDTAVTNGVTYYYQVAAINPGGEGPPSNETSATPAALPSTPGNLSAVPGNRFVSLSWDAPADDGGFPVETYRLYRGNASGAEAILADVGNVSAYDDPGLANGATFYYQVSAVTAKGEGPRSGEASAAPTAAPTRPSAPRNATANGESLRVDLAWEAPAHDGTSALLGYHVYRGTTPGNVGLLVGTTVGLTHSDPDVTAGIPYYYQVSALNSVGESSRSAVVVATPQEGPDTVGPTIDISTPTDGARLAGTQVAVSGTTDDNREVLTVEVSVDGVNWSLADGTDSWSATVTLVPGANTIHVRATDAAGNVGTASVSVVVELPSRADDPTPLVGALIAGAAVAGLAALWFYRRRRRRGDGSQGLPPPAP